MGADILPNHKHPSPARNINFVPVSVCEQTERVPINSNSFTVCVSHCKAFISSPEAETALISKIIQSPDRRKIQAANSSECKDQVKGHRPITIRLHNKQSRRIGAIYCYILLLFNHDYNCALRPSYDQWLYRYKPRWIKMWGSSP